MSSMTEYEKLETLYELLEMLSARDINIILKSYYENDSLLFDIVPLGSRPNRCSKFIDEAIDILKEMARTPKFEKGSRVWVIDEKNDTYICFRINALGYSELHKTFLYYPEYGHAQGFTENELFLTKEELLEYVFFDWVKLKNERDKRYTLKIDAVGGGGGRCGAGYSGDSSINKQ